LIITVAFGFESQKPETKKIMIQKLLRAFIQTATRRGPVVVDVFMDVSGNSGRQ
jgi:hypothetical protein